MSGSKSPKAHVSEQSRALQLLKLLRGKPDGLTAKELAAELGCSRIPVEKAQEWLERQGVKIETMRRPPPFRYRLEDPEARLPLYEPNQEDVAAVMLAAATLERYVDPSLATTLRQIAFHLDDLLQGDGEHGRTKIAVGSSGSRSEELNTVNLRLLLEATGRGVVDFTYDKVWAEDPSERIQKYRLEPWALRLHDGTIYVRGQSLKRPDTKKLPRTFRLASMRKIVRINATPKTQPPSDREIWADLDAAFGIDDHHPDTATIVLRGPVARYTAQFNWHPSQRDTFDPDTDTLTRVIPYRSERELARRIISVSDGLVSLKPARLNAAVATLGRVAAKLPRAEVPDTRISRSRSSSPSPSPSGQERKRPKP